MLDIKEVPLTKEHYDRIFEVERDSRYPLIDQFEKNWGYAIDREKLEAAARVLACPMKINPPNWQHGRIIYTVVRSLLRRFQRQNVHMVDVGTAKGFSALIMLWAAIDADTHPLIYSCDVIDPDARMRRNTVAEVDGFKTLYEILAPWPEALTSEINFKQLAGTTLLSQSNDRVHFAFVDGKHNYINVYNEANILQRRQQSGDITIFDDAQIPGVRQAVEAVEGYQKDYISANAHRKYCIATRL